MDKFGHNNTLPFSEASRPHERLRSVIDGETVVLKMFQVLYWAQINPSGFMHESESVNCVLIGTSWKHATPIDTLR